MFTAYIAGVVIAVVIFDAVLRFIYGELFPRPIEVLTLGSVFVIFAIFIDLALWVINHATTS